MEYSQIYDINRKMHMGPLGEVVRIITDCREKFNGLDVTLKEPDSDMEFNGRGILALLTISPFYNGTKVEIIAKGNYPKDKLKECVDRVGRIFSYRDTSRTTWEILYKSEYGHYPDEEPARK